MKTADDATKASTTAVPAPAKNPNEAVVELDTPIVRGDSSVTTVTLRKPSAGELRGVTLADVLQMDVQALRKVLPRITSPALTEQEIGRMDPADLVEIGSQVSTFLLRKSVKAEAFLTA